MPHTSSQAFLRELDKKAERRHSCRQPIAMATGMSPLPNLAGLIDLTATIPFQLADLHAKDILGHSPESSRSNPSSASLGDLCAFAVKNSSNANFAWVQHMLHHLAPNGSMALLLANGSMSSNSSGEGDIRRASNFCKPQLN